MKKLLVIALVLAFATVAMADVNSGKVTKKGDIGATLEYAPGQTVQARYSAGSTDPQVWAVTKLSGVYGLMDNLEVGLTRIADVPMALAALANHAWTAPGYTLSAAYGLNNVLGNMAMGADVKGKIEYSMPRIFAYSTDGQSVKPEDIASWKRASLGFSVLASKEMLAKGLTLGASLGVLNAWNEALNDTVVNTKGSSAFMLSAGADYKVMDNVCVYLTISHVDNSSLVGVEDSISAKIRENKVDTITLGARYDI